LGDVKREKGLGFKVQWSIPDLILYYFISWIFAYARMTGFARINSLIARIINALIRVFVKGRVFYPLVA
jgi:hypothetical protein